MNENQNTESGSICREQVAERDLSMRIQIERVKYFVMHCAYIPGWT